MTETSNSVVVNLASGHEDPERVTVAFLVATAALEKGKRVGMFLTKEAVRLGTSGDADVIEAPGAPPLSRLFAQYRDNGGELLVCPVCFNARQLSEDSLVSNASITGAGALWEWIGDGATVFSY